MASCTLNFHGLKLEKGKKASVLRQVELSINPNELGSTFIQSKIRVTAIKAMPL